MTDPPNIPAPLLAVSPSEEAIYHALGDWITSCLGDKFTILQGQQNDLPPPLKPFVLMILSKKERLATNGRHYHSDQSVTLSSSFLLSFDLICIGNGAGTAATCLKTLWRDLSCCEFFARNLPACAPVSAENPVQDPFITPEKNFENRWKLTVTLNVLSKITLRQESFCPESKKQ